MTIPYLALHILGFCICISTDCVTHVSTPTAFPESPFDQLATSIAIWERKHLPCTFAIATWLLNLSFYIRSMFYCHNFCLNEADLWP